MGEPLGETWVLANLANSNEAYCGPLSETTLLGTSCCAKTIISCLMSGSGSGQACNFNVPVHNQQVVRAFPMEQVCSNYRPRQCGKLCGHKGLCWLDSFLAAHKLKQLHTRSSNCHPIPGDHTDCLATSQHLVMPWWPV